MKSIETRIKWGLLDGYGDDSTDRSWVIDREVCLDVCI